MSSLLSVLLFSLILQSPALASSISDEALEVSAIEAMEVKSAKKTRTSEDKELDNMPIVAVTGTTSEKTVEVKNGKASSKALGSQTSSRSRIKWRQERESGNAMGRK
jgi:hypothetical protein